MTSTQPCCPQGSLIVGVATPRRHRNPGFDPHHTTTPIARPRTPPQKATWGLPQLPTNLFARKENLSLACAVALPHAFYPPCRLEGCAPSTHNQPESQQPTPRKGHTPTPPPWGTSRNPPRGLRLAHPAHTSTKNWQTPTTSARSVGHHISTETNRPPPDAKRTHPTPCGAGVSTTHTPEPNQQTETPSIEQDGPCASTMCRTSPSCESTQNPHGVDGCLKQRPRTRQRPFQVTVAFGRN